MSAFTQGYNACKQGYARWQNPYGYGTYEHTQWDAGWVAASCG